MAFSPDQAQQNYGGDPSCGLHVALTCAQWQQGEQHHGSRAESRLKLQRAQLPRCRETGRMRKVGRGSCSPVVFQDFCFSDLIATEAIRLVDDGHHRCLALWTAWREDICTLARAGVTSAKPGTLVSLREPHWTIGFRASFNGNLHRQAEKGVVPDVHALPAGFSRLLCYLFQVNWPLNG